ncbi:hypothetical protein AURANDRAFT_67916 [Aureococcus anophagefferens]|uniref:Uncharacterized protein n=1 Tax=Aureococcus anophagefferens TaxID=44056 RepID=F0YMV1_AURAN|nr:hypothetical protein AURANDRAFT_67916 [Aureococcus anophagefferens]EGB03572.1 hypothetical protein AURANDRAFT_67916 [Aureococcus anophagefferens]|eukprot:XP_009041722.1 hypothetical protein AURANDRAFT_67916 [Aureococcus anophagefferens]
MLSDRQVGALAAGEPPRPLSRRRGRRSAAGDDDDDDDDAPPALGALPKRPGSGAARGAWAADSDDSDSDDAVLSRAQIKERASAPAAVPAARPASRGGGRPSASKPGRASARLGFDLSGSLAALDQWSEHAEAHDDGAVRFTRGPVARSPQRADRPAPAPASPPCPDTARDAAAAVAPLDLSRPPGLAPPPGLAARASSSSFAAPPPTEAPEEDPAPREDPLLGAATRLDDDTVVGMLKQPPKGVRHLRTRDGFRKFFSGMPRGRMEALLTAAFADQPAEEATARLHKRLQLLDDLLV